MALHDYECPKCGSHFEKIFFKDNLPESVPCETCDGTAKHIITLGHGGIFRSDTEWVKKEVSPFFEIDGHRPMETIDDLRRFYKENPTIRPYESHPAFPSSLGDVPRPPDEATKKKERHKKAMEYLKKDQALTVNSRTSAKATPA